MKKFLRFYFSVRFFADMIWNEDLYVKLKKNTRSRRIYQSIDMFMIEGGTRGGYIITQCFIEERIFIEMGENQWIIHSKSFPYID